MRNRDKKKLKLCKTEALKDFRITLELEKEFNKFGFIRNNELGNAYFEKAECEWQDNDLLLILPVKYIDYRELNLIFKFIHKYQATITYEIEKGFILRMRRESIISALKIIRNHENY